MNAAPVRDAVRDIAKCFPADDKEVAGLRAAFATFAAAQRSQTDVAAADAPMAAAAADDELLRAALVAAARQLQHHVGPLHEARYRVAAARLSGSLQSVRPRHAPAAMLSASTAGGAARAGNL